MLGQTYTTGMSLSTEKATQVWNELRTAYSSYGLGNKDLGFDIPGAASGLIGPTTEEGKVLFEAFGQYDEYSPLQMAVYAATLANGGKRVAPHIVDGIY